jgi:hypothetical protein
MKNCKGFVDEAVVAYSRCHFFIWPGGLKKTVETLVGVLDEIGTRNLPNASPWYYHSVNHLDVGP